MSKFNEKNGMPAGNDHLCRTCSHGQFTTGYRETDVMVICATAEPSRLVPFPVHECTAYWDRHRPSMQMMQKYALNLVQERKKPVQGFCAARLQVVSPKREESASDEQPNEAALADQ